MTKPPRNSLSSAALPADLDPMEIERHRLLEALKHDPLGQLLSPRRAERMVDVLMQRLSSLTVVMENLSDPHNVSAVVRTAEGFGLDAVHMVELPNRYQRHASILKGADRWVQIVRHQRLGRCLGDLSAAGFVLCAADVGPGCVPIDALPVDQPIAVVMGSERDGLSRRAKSMVDMRFTIPMTGFTQSFNVSVSAAVTLYELSRRRREAIGGRSDLTASERDERLAVWLKKTMKRSEIILRASEGAAGKAPKED